jgi:hypothetical protein
VTEFGEQPVYRALWAIQKGTRPDGSPLVEGQEPTPLKLAKDSLGRYDAETIKKLRSLDAYRVKDGVDVETAADLLGFSSGDELVKALKETPGLKASIEAETDARMTATHGDLLLDGTLHDQAEAAVFGSGRQKVVEAELKALGAALVKGTIPPASVIKAQAADRIGSTRVRDLRPGLHLMAAERASRKAFDLLNTQNDREGAVSAKQQELVELALYREAVKARDAAESARDYLGPHFDKATVRERIGKVPGGYLEQIDGFRERYDFSRTTLKENDRRASLASFIAAETAKGHELAIPLELQDDARRVNYRDLTVDELRGVKDSVQSIEHWARFKDKLLRQQEKRDLVELATSGAASIAEHAGTRPTPALEPRLPGAQRTRDVKGWLLAHRPLLALLREMDGFRDGFLFDHIWRPAHEARTAEITMGRDAKERMTAIHDARFKGQETDLYAQTYIPALQNSLSTAARLAVAFNYGNEGNRERLVSSGIGNSGPLSEPKIQAILATLTPADWAYVNDTTTLVNSYKGQIGSLYKRVTGVEPTWVDATPFHSPHGDQPGGYYPIAYEGRASARALPGPESTFADILAKSSYMRFQTANGHTEARVAHTGIPLRADLGVIGEHLQQVIHDLTHREMLIDVGRLLGRSELQDAIYKSYGDQYYKEIQGAFRDVAIGPMPSPDWYRVIAPLRKGASMARLAWNFATMVRHVTNLTSGMVRVGPGEVMAAIPQWLGSAKDAEASTGWITGHSELMASRWNHRMEELASLNTDMGLKRGPWAAKARDLMAHAGIDPNLGERVSDTYLYGIHKIIQTAEIPTWIAAYKQALDAEPNQARAIASADNAVLDAFGGGDTLDLAGVQRSYGGKLFTTFMTYTLSLHRQNYEIFHKDSTYARKVIDATLLNIMPTLLLTGVFHQVHSSQSYTRDLAEAFFDHAAGMFVFVREVAGALRHPDYFGPSALAPIGVATRMLYQVGRTISAPTEDKALKRAGQAAKAGAELAGQFYGVPTAQIEKTAEGLLDVMEGKGEASEILFGPKPKKASGQ